MALYLLKRKLLDYDEFDAKVIRAKNSSFARALANRKNGSEGKIWCNHSLVTCEIIQPTGAEEEILASFNAG